jgi:hypothetical protein
MWIKVLKDWDWRERPSALVAYKKDQILNVPKKARDEGVAAGAMEDTKAPKKDEVSSESPARFPRADGQNNLPTEADLGEPEGAAGSAATGGTPAGGSPSAT